MSNLTPTPIVDKNGKQTTVHKNLNTGTTDVRAAGVGTPRASAVASSGSPRDAYLDEVDSLVDEYVANGLLHSVRTMNGDRRYSTGDVLIGRDSEGNRIYVKIEVEHVNKPRRTTDLDEVAESWDISFTGLRKYKGATGSDGGQIVDDMNDIQSGIGSSAIELGQIWKDNHLNGLNAGTDIQKAQVDAILAESGERFDYSKIAPQIPDDRGYKYGHEWLAKDFSVEAAERALSILDTARGLTIK